MKKILLIITILLLTSACSSSSIKTINLKTLNEMLDNKETFILYLTDESDGKVLENTLKNVSKKNKLQSYSLNTIKLKDEELNSLKDIFAYENTNIILFIKEGKEETVLSRINNLYISEEKLEQEIKNQGYIE